MLAIGDNEIFFLISIVNLNLRQKQRISVKHGEGGNKKDDKTTEATAASPFSVKVHQDVVQLHVAIEHWM